MNQLGGITMITIENKLFSLKLGEDGIAQSLILKATGEECIAKGSERNMGSPDFATSDDATYAPAAEITPCEKFVVNDVRNIRVMAIVTIAVTHIGISDPNTVLRKYAIYYPHLMIFAAHV